MGSKRRIVLVLLLAVCMVIGTGQISLARVAEKANDVRLKGTITEDSAIQLNWKAFPGAKFYLVYRAPVVDGYRAGRYKHVGTAYSNSYVDSNVGKGMTYRYFLRFGVGKKSYKSPKKNVHVGIDPPRFLVAKDGGDAFSSTDYNRITLVVVPGGGTKPDRIVLQRKSGKKFKTIDKKDYGKDAADNGYKLEFVDRDVKAGGRYEYRIRSVKGKGDSATKSKYSYITMTALNQVGKYRLCWAPRTLNQDNTIVLQIEAQAYNYDLVLDKKNRCEVILSDGGSMEGQKSTARISHFSVDGRNWTKAPNNYRIKGGTSFVAITGKGVGMNTVNELVIPGKYSGKNAGLPMKNLLKLYFLQIDTNLEFYGNNEA